MAVRTPVYWDGSSLKKMNASQITAIKERCVYLFGGSSRPVNLDYIASSGNLNAMTDTRDTAGNLTQTQTSNSVARGFANNSPGNTNDAAVSVTEDHINQTVSSPSDPGDTNNVLYPLFLDGTSSLQAMSKTDMYDTFINDAIELLIDGNDRDGIYKLVVSNGDTSNATLVSSNPVFVDTRFNKAIHGGATGTSVQEILPLSSVDKPDNGGTRTWKIYRTNQGTAYGTPSIQIPVHANTDGSIQEYSAGAFDTVLENLLFYTATSRSPYRIRYNITGTGRNSQSISDAVNTPVATNGDAVTDTTLNSQVRINDQDGGTYYSQNLPTGSGETETTYELKIYRK